LASGFLRVHIHTASTIVMTSTTGFVAFLRYTSHPLHQWLHIRGSKNLGLSSADKDVRPVREISCKDIEKNPASPQALPETKNEMDPGGIP